MPTPEFGLPRHLRSTRKSLWPHLCYLGLALAVALSKSLPRGKRQREVVCSAKLYAVNVTNFESLVKIILMDLITSTR